MQTRAITTRNLENQAIQVCQAPMDIVGLMMPPMEPHYPMMDCVWAHCKNNNALARIMARKFVNLFN